MRVVLAKNTSPNNINLAYVEGEKITSDDVLQFKDSSGEASGNPLPIFTEAREAQTYSNDNSDLEVNLVNESINPEVTKEYNFIKQTAEVIPLWEKYIPILPYFNNSSRKKTFVIDSLNVNQEYQILSSESKVLLCANTLRVRNDSKDIEINENDYIYNNGTRKLKITKDTAENDRIHVTFYVINNTVSIKDDLGNEIESKYLRVEPEKHKTTPDGTDTDSYDYFGDVGSTGDSNLANLFNLEILLADILEDDKTYFIEYLSYNINTSATNVQTEVLNTSPLYGKVDEILATHTKKDRVFEVEDETGESEHPIITTVPEEWPKVFVKYTRERNTKLSIMEPKNSPHNDPWFVEISNEKLIQTHGGNSYTYRPLERFTQNIINDQYQIVKVKEPINKIDRALIKTQYKNLHIVKSNNNIPTNITIYNKGSNITNLIKYIDVKRGRITLNRDTNIDYENSYIEYYRYIYNVQYKNINVNPFMIYNQTNNTILDKYVVIFMLPNEELDTSKKRSIFHTIVYKYPNRYDSVEPHQLSIENAVSYINGESVDGHSFLYDKLQYYLSSDIEDGDELHPLILGYVSSTNITSASSLEYIDIRRHGGGLVESQDVNELTSNNERHYIDIAKIDGYNYDLSNICIVKIKQRVKNDIINKLSKYDPHAQRQIRDNNSKFDIAAYAESFIEASVAKYLNAAANFTIVYEE